MSEKSTVERLERPVPVCIAKQRTPIIYVDDAAPFMVVATALIQAGCTLENDGSGNVVVRYRGKLP